MNHTYRLVWSDASQRYVPVPECARGRSKSRAAKALMPAALVLGMALGLPLSALAQAGTIIGANTLPTGGSVVQGSASIGQNGNAMTVQQGSGKAIINWGSFNIGKDASVQFQQHQNTDIALNRVTGSDGSQILGQLTANGQVWLVNPNGIVFGQGARVDVGGLVASTLNITDQDFRDGNYRFSRNLQGSGAVGGISNQGQITARDGGSIALLAPSVSNDGVLRAQLGTVAMAAGDRVTLSAGANGLLQVEVDPSTIGTLVENKQLIVADGGQVIMTGKAADALSASVVSNTGTVQARTLQHKEGRILLLADMAHGTARIGGTLDASAPGGINGGGNGGFIETSGAQVQVADGAQVTTRAVQGSTGTWLIDPTDFSVHAGAGAQAASGIGADTLAANLANNHITLQTDGAGSQAGDLTFDAAVTWGSNNKLTLQAHNDIKVNAAITNTGSGSFAASAGRHFSNAAAISLAGGDISITSGTAPGTFGNTHFGAGVRARNLEVRASGDITQGGGGLLDLGTTGELRAQAGGTVDLSGFGNVFGVVSGSSDRGYFSVLRSGHSTAGSLTVNGITTQGGDIAARNFWGDLSVNGAVSSGGGHIALGANNGSDSNVTLGADINAGAGSVVLFAARNIDQTAGMMTAGTLQAMSMRGGTINLGQLNQVDRVGFNANLGGGTGSIVFRNGQGFAAGGMSTGRMIAGLYFTPLPTDITAGGDVTLSGLGRIDGSGVVNVGGVFTLAGGDWRQVGAALPSFQAKDFRIGSGASFLRVNGGDGSLASPYQISDVYGLQGMGSSSQYLASAWTLMNDIDASTTANWNLNGGVAEGFKPIGNSGVNFTGALDGRGFAIKDLKVNTVSQDAGLFGRVSGATISNVALSNASVASQHDQGYVGALAGQAQGSTISGVSSSGSVTSYNLAGGLLGFMSGGSRLQRSSSSKVTASYQKADGNISAQLVHMAGGLVGSMNGSTIEGSWASGDVVANGLLEARAGGLVGGGVMNSTISGSYSDSDITGQGSTGVNTSVGGLVGQAVGGLAIDNSYYSNNNSSTKGLRTLSVNGSNRLGGLVGADDRLALPWISGVSIRNSYAEVGYIQYPGSMTGGGLVGKADSETRVVGSFWRTIFSPDATGNGLGTVDALSGFKTAAQLRQLSTFTDAGWDIDDLGGTGKTWRIYDGYTSPLLRSFLKPGVVTIGLGSSSKTYDKQLGSGTVSSWGYLGEIDGLFFWTLPEWSTTSVNAGTYRAEDGSLKVRGFYSSQQGSDLSFAASYAINKRLLVAEITGDGVTKTYDGTTGLGDAVAPYVIVAGLRAGDSFSTSSSNFAFADKNAGTNKTLNISGITVFDGNGGNNYEVSYLASGNNTITPKSITATITADSKVYDATAAASTHGRLDGGVLENDDLTVESASGSFTDKNVGLGKTVTINGITLSGADAGNYNVTFNGTTQADIAKRAITGVITADNKIYDGNTNAVTRGDLSRGGLNGVVASDSVTVGSTGQFSDKNAGTGKTVNVAGTVSGTDAGNYDVTFNTTTTADIDRRAITGTITADNKIYDGNTNAVTQGDLSRGGLNGVVANDSVTVGSTGQFSDKNAGQGKTVNVAGTVTGADADNYDVTFNTTTQADIDKRAITGTITADNKIYDGNTNAVTQGELSRGGLNGVVSSDDVTVGSTGQFSDKNAGTGKTVNVAGTVSGTDAENYEVTFNTTAQADIAKRAITGTITADNKIYDGNRNAVTQGDLSRGGLNGVVANDSVTVGSTGQFSDKNAGTGKTVTVSGTLGGADAENYEVTFNTTAQADIAKRAITGVITADSKTYDSNRNAATHGGLNGVLNNDDLRIASTSGSFADKNAGTGKTVNVAGTITGTDAGNYDVTFNSTTTADIAKLAITGAITADGKIYDGNVQAVTHGRLNGVLNNDDLTVASTSGSFSDKNAGTGKTVNVGGTVAGADAGNYDVTFNGTTTADIAKLAITGAITADGKTYDGNVQAVTHGSLNGVLNNDDLTVASTSGQFSDKNAGTGKTVNVGGTVAGADAGNYDVTFNTSTAADIAKLAITGAITADGKTYDGNVQAVTHGGLNGVLSGDDLTVAGSGQFSDKNAGTGKTVNVSGVVAGADAGNYDVTFNGTTTADIAKLAINGVITADGKTYDGDRTAVTHGSLVGVLTGDDLTVAATNGSFTDKNAGTGKTVHVGGAVAGADAGNYDVTFNTSTTADIAKRAINGVITADGKTYDGNVQAVTHGSLNGVLTGDDLTVAATSGSFTDKNAGTGKTVHVGGMVTGADVGNYDVTFNTSTTADIAKRAINGAITADGKTYDGNVQAVTHGSLNGVLNNDDLTVASTSGQFSDKNAGTGKTVNVGGTVAGADAGNYDVTFNTSTAADIAKLAITGAITADGKTYDGNVQAVTHGGLNGVLNNDDLRIASTSGSFADKNAGTGKTVNVAGTVTGTDAGNYDVTFNGTAKADIAKLAINGSITVDNKTYDATTNASTHGQLNGVLAGDDLKLAVSGQFSDKNAAAGKTVAVVGTVTGTDAGNYDVTFNGTAKADIAKLAINGSITVDNKTYDATTNASTHGQLNGVLAGDDLKLAASGQFGDKNAAAGKTVAVVGTVTGADAGNYDVTFNSTAQADIAKRAITGVIAVDNKTYDATINAGTRGQLNGVLAGDDLTVASTSGSFSDKNAGVGKSVKVAGVLAGTDAGNYDVTFNSTAQASIAKRAITGAITADNKVYDGTTVASVHASLDGVLAGDDLGLGGVSGQFREADVGVGKPVDVSGIVTGADAGNYAVSINRTTTASITSALPAPTVHAGLSGQILWRETTSSLEHEDLQFAPLAQLQGSAGSAPNLTLAPGYIRLDE